MRSDSGGGGVRVAVVDDHPLWSETVARIVAQRGVGEVVAVFGSRSDAEGGLEETDPDVVVMDLELPDGHGVELTRWLAEDHPDIRVIVLSSSDDRADVVAALDAGARGYLVKTAGAAEVAEGIQRVAGGEVVMPSSLSDVLLGEFRRRGSKAGLADASPTTPVASRGRRGTFRRDGETWHLALGEGPATAVPHLRGFEHLVLMLRAPGQEIHVLDLAAGGTGLVGAAAAPVLDDAAKQAFQERLDALAGEIERATARGDERARGRAEEERDALVAELRGAVGLAGRDRRHNDEAERARTAVGRSIRRAIERIADFDADLAGHLERAVATGIFCSYDPETPVDWTL